MSEQGKKRIHPKIKATSTQDIINSENLESENLVRLKITTRKGSRIESVPLKKLEKLADKKRLYWKLTEDWLILYGF